MSAKRSLLRHQLQRAGWKGPRARRRRGVPLDDAVRSVAVVRGILRARDRLGQSTEEK